MTKYFTKEEVAAHNTESSMWIIVHGKVYDITNFLDEHPGGKKVLIKVAGTDASKQFDTFHNQAILDKWGPKLYIGDVGTGATESSSQDDNSDFSEGALFGELIPFGDPSWYQGFHSPYYNESHRRLRKAVREFVEKEIDPYCYEWDEAKKIDPELYVKCAKAGILPGVTGQTWPSECVYFFVVSNVAIVYFICYLMLYQYNFLKKKN